jgi:hypothetical protein
MWFVLVRVQLTSPRMYLLLYELASCCFVPVTICSSILDYSFEDSVVHHSEERKKSEISRQVIIIIFFFFFFENAIIIKIFRAEEKQTKETIQNPPKKTTKKSMGRIFLQRTKGNEKKIISKYMTKNHFHFFYSCFSFSFA